MNKVKILIPALTLALTLALAIFGSRLVHAQNDETEQGRIYWGTGNTIFRGKLDASNPEPVLVGVPLLNPVLSADGTQMFGIGSDDVIRRANVDGSNLVELLAPGNDPAILKIDTEGGKLYWLDDTSVRRANLDGGQVETLVTGQSNPIALQLDTQRSKLYWIDDVNQIRRANFDGTGVELVYSAATSDERVFCLHVDAVDNHVYWLLRDISQQGTVMRANGDGTSVQTLPVGNICPILNQANRKIYWHLYTEEAQSIQRSNLDGTEIEEIVTDVNFANSLSFDMVGGMIYWYEAFSSDPKIRRADLDGGPASDLVKLPEYPSSFFLNVSQGQMGWEVDGVLMRADLNGENQRPTLVGISIAGQLALDLENRRIFWVGGASIRVANLDGSESEIFWENTDENSDIFGVALRGVDEAAGKLYWNTVATTPASIAGRAQTLEDVLFRANLDGSGVQEVGRFPSTFSPPFAIDFVNQHIYGHLSLPDNDLATELARANFDGTGIEGLGIIDRSSSPNLVVDGAGGKIYWTTGGTTAFIQQANLDGSGQVEFMDGLDSPGMLAIDTKGGKLYWTSEPVGEDRLTERANLDGSARETFAVDNVNAFAFDPEGLGTPDPDEPDPDPEAQNLRLPLIRGD